MAGSGLGSSALGAPGRDEMFGIQDLMANASMFDPQQQPPPQFQQQQGGFGGQQWDQQLGPPPPQQQQPQQGGFGFQGGLGGADPEWQPNAKPGGDAFGSFDSATAFGEEQGGERRYQQF